MYIRTYRRTGIAFENRHDNSLLHSQVQGASVKNYKLRHKLQQATAFTPAGRLDANRVIMTTYSIRVHIYNAAGIFLYGTLMNIYTPEYIIYRIERIDRPYIPYIPHRPVWYINQQQLMSGTGKHPWAEPRNEVLQQCRYYSCSAVF